MKEKTPMSVKLESGVHARLEECSKRTRIKKYALALMAIEAVVDAIERNDYRLVVPIEFEVAKVPAPRATYTPHREQHMVMEDEPKGKASSAATRDTLRKVGDIVRGKYPGKTPPK